MTYQQADFKDNQLLQNHYISSAPTKVSKDLFSINALNKTYTITATPLTALNAMLSVKWQAKVKDSRYELLSEELLFYPDVQNLKYTIFPKYSEVLQQSKNLKYPMDANYSGLSGKKTSELTSEFLYRSQVQLPSFSSYTPALSQVNSYRPLPENTMSGEERGVNVITRTVIVVTMMPKALKGRLTSDDVANKNYSWILWNRQALTAKAFLNKYTAAKAKSNKTSEDQRIITDGNKIIKNGELVKKGYEDEQIKYFYQGQCYYAVPITHFTPEQLGGTLEQGGYYGVVRNHHYQLDIRSVGSVGKASYDALPIDTEYSQNAHLSSIITIQDMDEIINIIETLE